MVRAHENELHRLRGVILVALGKAYLKRHWLRKARLCFYEALNNTSTPNKYAVQAIYGLGLVSMIDLSAIGSDDIEVSYRHVTRVMTKLHRSLQQLPSISTDKLIKAQDYFQHDFDIPLKRYRVIEAVTLWLSQQNGEYSGE